MQNVSSYLSVTFSKYTKWPSVCLHLPLTSVFFPLSGGGVLHHHQLVLSTSGLRYMISARVKGYTAMKTLCRKYKWAQIKIVCSLKEYYSTTATLSHLIWGGMFTQTMDKSLTSEQSTQQRSYFISKGATKGKQYNDLIKHLWNKQNTNSQKCDFFSRSNLLLLLIHTRFVDIYMELLMIKCLKWTHVILQRLGNS